MEIFREQRPLAYICSPYHAEDQEGLALNIELARAAVLYAIECRYAPIAPHLYIPQLLGDDGEFREIGLICSCSLVRACDEIWVCTEDLSPGMAREVAVATMCNIPRRDVWAEEGYAEHLAEWGDRPASIAEGVSALLAGAER